MERRGCRKEEVGWRKGQMTRFGEEEVGGGVLTG